MRMITKKRMHIVFAFLIIFLFEVLKCNVSAEESNDTVVKVGYYENFQKLK